MCKVRRNRNMLIFLRFTLSAKNLALENLAYPWFLQINNVKISEEVQVIINPHFSFHY